MLVTDLLQAFQPIGHEASDGTLYRSEWGALLHSDLGGKVVSNSPRAQSQSEQGHQNRMSLLAGLPGALPTVNMTSEDKESWEQGKAAGALSGPLVAGATTAAGAPGMAAALAAVAKKYGIKALEGAGLGAGYDLYRELKKAFEGE